MIKKLLSKLKYPGDGYYYIICDICGAKIRRKDAKETWGTRGNLLVCHKDYEDPHPQDYLPAPRPRRKLISTRGEGTDIFEFIDNVDEIEDGNTGDPSPGNTSGAPTDLTAVAESSSKIVLTWRMDKTDIGQAAIDGFKIERESPISGGFSTLTENTGFPSLYYEDTNLSASTQYNYRVSAVNLFGTGSASNEADDTTSSS